MNIASRCNFFPSLIENLILQEKKKSLFLYCIFTLQLSHVCVSATTVTNVCRCCLFPQFALTGFCLMSGKWAETERT